MRCFEMKKYLLAWVLLLCSTWAFLSPAYAGSNGSLTLDGIYSKRLSGIVGHENGLGGSILLEWQPVESFSIGVDADTILYFGAQTPGISAVESVNLLGRYIINPGEDWTVYVMVGGGLNPKLDLKAVFLWVGDFHLMGGPGAWCFLSPQVAVDMGLVFDYYNNTAPVDPLNMLNLRAGLSFFFENTKKQAATTASAAPASQTAVPTQAVVEATPVPAVATPTPTEQVTVATPVAKVEAVASTVTATVAKAKAAIPAVKAKVATPVVEAEAAAPAAKAEAEAVAGEMTTVLSAKGDSLWDTAARKDVYGDPELYPLLVDANKAVLKPKQFVLEPDTKLSVPKDPTQDMIAKARKDAWTAKYQQFSGRRLSPEGYQKWRVTHGLSAPAN
jgi:hypothetical protein